MDNALPERSPDLKDWKGGLVFFGILQILIGLFCALISAVSVLGILFARFAGPGMEEMMNVKMAIPSIVIYGLGAVLFFWLGIGSITAKRWARALMLIISTVWLAVGVPAFGFSAYLVPAMMDMMRAQGQISDVAFAVARFIMIAVYFVLFVALPGAFFLFYRSPHVKSTVERRDPVPRWTDRRPLPVLGLSLLLFAGAISLLPMLAFPGLPFLGRMLSGPSLAAYVIIFSALLLFLAKAVYDLRMSGWIGALVLPLLGYGAATATFLMMDYGSFYRAMGYTERQIELLHIAEMWEHTGMVPAMIAMMVIMLALWTGYLFYVRKFFVTTSSLTGGRP